MGCVGLGRCGRGCLLLGEGLVLRGCALDLSHLTLLLSWFGMFAFGFLVAWGAQPQICLCQWLGLFITILGRGGPLAGAGRGGRNYENPGASGFKPGTIYIYTQTHA